MRRCTRHTCIRKRLKKAPLREKKGCLHARSAFRSLPWAFSEEPLVFVPDATRPADPDFLSLSLSLLFSRFSLLSLGLFIFSPSRVPLWFAFVIFCAYPFFPRDSFISSRLSSFFCFDCAVFVFILIILTHFSSLYIFCINWRHMHSHERHLIWF